MAVRVSSVAMMMVSSPRVRCAIPMMRPVTEAAV